MTPSTHIYYWPRSFILFSRDFEQNKPYQRISTTLIVSIGGEFAIETGDRGAIACAGIVLGPAAKRMSLRIAEPGALIIEAAPNTVEQYALMQFLRHAPTRVLDEDTLQALRAELRPYGSVENWSPEVAQCFHQQAIAVVAPLPDTIKSDARVQQVLEHLESEPLDEVSIAGLALRMGLSESRLRSLVRRQLSCSLSQYVRWLAAWRTLVHWRPGVTLTDAAHAAGFHDLSHANHTFNEMFGLSPSRVLRPEQVRLVACASA
jgi:AraC-like DNA-binding protein